MKVKVMDAVADILKREGVAQIFGNNGGHITSMWEAAMRAGIDWIINKHEGNAVYMADGYYRASGKIPVVLATVGPGVMNLTTGLANAHFDSIPLIAIGAACETWAAGRNAFQDSSGRGRSIEQRLVFKAICKQAFSALTPASIPLIVQEAFRVALTGRPGPVYIEVPSDFWLAEIDYQPRDPGKYKYLGESVCSESESKRIFTALYEAKRPLILVGEAWGNYSNKTHVTKFLNDVNVPFGTSAVGKNFVDEFSPMYLGSMRPAGERQKLLEYMKSSDFLLVLGDRMHKWQFAGYDPSLVAKATIAQVDTDSDEIGRVHDVSYSAVGSLSSFASYRPQGAHPMAEKLRTELRELFERYPKKQKRYPSSGGLNPLAVNDLVEDFSNEDSIIVTDTGYSKMMIILKYRRKSDQVVLVTDKFGPMGWGLPAAIGAAMATKKEVICVIGDAGIQTGINELAIHQLYGHKVIYVIVNNGGQWICADHHKNAHGHDGGNFFPSPNFVKIAEAYGLSGIRVETEEDLQTAFERAKSSEKSVVIDVVTDQKSMVWE